MKPPPTRTRNVDGAWRYWQAPQRSTCGSMHQATNGQNSWKPWVSAVMIRSTLPVPKRRAQMYCLRPMTPLCGEHGACSMS